MDLPPHWSLGTAERPGEVGIESDAGFELAIELVAKARRHRRPVAEIPTLWLERTDGASNFKMWKWLPRYFHWYFYAFGPRIKESARADNT